jgi:hypothetical protein
MKVFILPSGIKNEELLDDVNFMAYHRRPSVNIQFQDPDFRFYLSWYELRRLRNDHRIDGGSHSEYAILGSVEYEPGEHITSLKRGLNHVANHVGLVDATVIRVTDRHGFYTFYEVELDAPSPPRKSDWLSWLMRRRSTSRNEREIWPNAHTLYIDGLTGNQLIDLDLYESD